MLEKDDPKKFDSIETQWGKYPILAIKAKLKDQLLHLAWVGLNDPEAGWTLLFNLVYPDKKGHPNEHDLALWENLVMKTTQLTDGDYFKAYGQDLQEGYTLVNIGGAKLKMMAEKRQRDGALQVVVTPENSNVEFHYDHMMECLMGAQWKYGEPMVKIYGEIVLNEERMKLIDNTVISILYKTVSEFSIKKEEIKEKTHLVFLKEQQ